MISQLAFLVGVRTSSVNPFAFGAQVADNTNGPAEKWPNGWPSDMPSDVPEHVGEAN
jgi:hypothetical protein